MDVYVKAPLTEADPVVGRMVVNGAATCISVQNLTYTLGLCGLLGDIGGRSRTVFTQISNLEECKVAQRPVGGWGDPGVGP